MEGAGNLLMLKDTLKKLLLSQAQWFCTHRQVYHSEIGRYTGKIKCLSEAFWPKGLLQRLLGLERRF